MAAKSEAVSVHGAFERAMADRIDALDEKLNVQVSELRELIARIEEIVKANRREVARAFTRRGNESNYVAAPPPSLRRR